MNIFEFFESLERISSAIRAGVLVEAGALIVEDGVILEKETQSIIAELDEFHRQNAIDYALATNNRDAFIQLTNKED
ncbi:hypothetical protein P9B03_04060 [Metasolibacillus meyeri]|uniref:Uncharacterized protein n=1 Tax=Metasolibacillus meyeri TaxID=1071052 RepID=A0AAW9NGC8_9BACL|nr:hypothetical protein [Metasolibacillus meyeri]MEC1177649.1 hypothetical protein [Metasolibacillus meyeri]